MNGTSGTPCLSASFRRDWLIIIGGSGDHGMASLEFRVSRF
jgi:hypothetical protein